MGFDHTLYIVDEIDRGNLQGSNQKGILFVYAVDDKDHHDFLMKIIGAINCENSEVLQLTLKKNSNVSLIPFLKENSIEKVVVFGIEPHRFCLNVEYSKYGILHLDGIRFLIADGLGRVGNEKDLKKHLWIGLKEMFGI